MSETPQTSSFLQLEKKIGKAVSEEVKDFAKSYQKVVRPVLRAKIKAELAKEEAVKAKEEAVKAKEKEVKNLMVAKDKIEDENKKLSLRVHDLEKDLVSIWLIFIRILNLVLYSTICTRFNNLGML